MKVITLNREQISRMIQLVEHFEEVDQFTIEEKSSSENGVVKNLKFYLSDNMQAKIAFGKD